MEIIAIIVASVIQFIVESITQFILKLCTHINNQTGYVTHFEENVEALNREAEALEAEIEGIQSEEQQALREQKRLTKQAQNWLTRAQKSQEEIQSIKSDFDERQTSSNGSFSDLKSRYRLGKRAAETLERVRRDLNDRSGIKLVAMYSAPRVVEMGMLTSSVLVGQRSSQRTMDKIWNLLHDEHTSVICVYGMGGIGKTTLMKAINKKLLHTTEFKYVIWVTVSKDRTSESLQKEIMRRLRLQCDEDDSYNSRSDQLCQYLTNERFMLILDDLWNSIDLSEVGIPINTESRSKIVITTRDQQLFTDMSADLVCNDMKAKKIRVKALPADEAWDLFATNVGKNVVDQPDIKEIAEAVAKECGGLPLAMRVVAKAMQGKDKKELWEDALRALKASAPEIRGMEPKVFLPLKKSYDDLGDEKVKMCFLYCSLFPEDYEIHENRLARLWIMEGFIDNVDNLYDGSNKGHTIIEMLKSRCLLEKGYESNRAVKKYDAFLEMTNRAVEMHDEVIDDLARRSHPAVQMHDVIRDLALYIASSSCKEGPKFLVKAGFGDRLNEAPPGETWREFERISFMKNGIDELPIKPECPNLVSLYLTENPITVVPQTFFELMPALQVLDLSYCNITSLSVSSSSLLNLRALDLTWCQELTEVPFLGQLKELQFLDISYSGIKSLPKELQNLVKLRRLNMSHLSNLRTIPSNVISELSSLEDLRMHVTHVNWAKGSELAVENDVRLGEVAKLKRLTILAITIEDFDCLGEDVLDLHQWSKFKKFKLFIGHVFSKMDCMKQVLIYGGGNYLSRVKGIMTFTEGLRLMDADYVKDVSQLVGVANGLRMLEIGNCKEMECILDWSDVGENALQNVQILNLWKLPRLQNLFKGEVPQRCLQKLNRISLHDCGQLKSLFSSEMVQNLNQLETLVVDGCEELEEIIEGDKSLPEIPFPQLRELRLYRLDKLKSIIHQDTLTLPSLIGLDIKSCPVLRLPERPNTTDWPSITSGKAFWKS